MGKHKSNLGWMVVAAIGTYAAIRRLGTRGGATDDEVYGSLPGDDIIPHPMVETTHSVTIQAPPERVWPWLMQAGYRGAGRAGWYGESPINRPFEVVLRALVPPENMPEREWASSPRTLLPGFSDPAVGDTIPDGPPGTAWFEVRAIEHERVYALYSDSHLKWISPLFLKDTRWASYGEFTWVFILRPTGSGATRFILRTRASYGPRAIRALFEPLLYLAEAIWPRLILNGIRGRAEAT
jgi:hypothetical protein